MEYDLVLFAETFRKQHFNSDVYPVLEYVNPLVSHFSSFLYFSTIRYFLQIFAIFLR